MAKTARLFFDDSEHNADLYYLTAFLAGDPILYLECDGKRELFLSDLEVDRARRQSRVDAVVRLEPIREALEKELKELPQESAQRMGLFLRRIARERGIGSFEVRDDFPVSVADVLRGHGFGLRWRAAPFVEERALKRPDEVEKIRRAIAHTEAALMAAIDRIRASEIRDGLLWEDGEPLTSEKVRFTIHKTLLERNCHPYEAIVAGGEQGVDPHERGHGPLPANRPIILDVFPQDLETRYHGDMTRTVVRGTASDEVKRMFDAVQAAKACAESRLRDGAQGEEVHKAVEESFKAKGFETGERGGRMVGFFHGTGHGLGLAVHEHPGIGKRKSTLRAGHVVTVEPGLYYPGLGGVRIEDDLLVTESGCQNLCTLSETP